VVDANADSVRYALSTPEAVDQIPLCSRESVSVMPTSRSCARYDAARPSSVMNSEACLLFTAFTISAIERSMSAPAWNSVASSAPARSFQ
jgi:hypothetical protein